MKRDIDGAIIFHREGKQKKGLEDLCHETRGLRVADVGTNMGESAEIFCDYFGEVYAIDTWSKEHLAVVRMVTGFNVDDGEVEESFNIRMRSAGGQICKVKEDSISAAGRFPDRFFDLVYIDASHDYDSVVADIKVWRFKTEFIGGHDFCDTGDVRRAVMDEFRMPGWLFCDSSWLVRLRGATDG